MIWLLFDFYYRFILLLLLSCYIALKKLLQLKFHLWKKNSYFLSTIYEIVRVKIWTLICHNPEGIFWRFSLWKSKSRSLRRCAIYQGILLSRLFPQSTEVENIFFHITTNLSPSNVMWLYIYIYNFSKIIFAFVFL